LVNGKIQPQQLNKEAAARTHPLEKETFTSARNVAAQQAGGERDLTVLVRTVQGWSGR
jgi:hypothetical protein